MLHSKLEHFYLHFTASSGGGSPPIGQSNPVIGRDGQILDCLQKYFYWQINRNGHCQYYVTENLMIL